jgi:hypothetical protein
MDIFAKIASLHPLVAYLLLFCIFMGLTLISSLAIHRFVDAQMRKRHNDIAGFFFGVVGVVYGVLLAFITVGVWEQYNSAAETVDKEAFAAQLMVRNLSLYADKEQAEELRQQLKVYLHAAVKEEFPAMGKMEKSPATDQALDDLWAKANELKPKGFYEQFHYKEILNNLSSITHFRDKRIETANNPSLIGVIRFIIILGALITLFFAVIFAVENFWWHIVMTAMLALLLCTILFILLELGHPFLSGISLQPDGYRELLGTIASK